LGKPVIRQVHGVELVLLYFSEKVVEGHGVGALSEAVFNVDLVEERYHVFSLVLGGVEVLDTVEDHHHDDLMRHDARFCQKVLVALLNSFYRGLQHVLRLRVHAYADRQLYTP